LDRSAASVHRPGRKLRPPSPCDVVATVSSLLQLPRLRQLLLSVVGGGGG